MYYYKFLKRNRTKIIYFLLPSLFLGIMYFFILMSDDNYWKKEESYYFVSFYKSSIQGKLTHKERVRDGDFIQVEGTDEEIRLREMKNEVDQNFFEYVSVGNELKKEPYTRNLCIVTNREENCFKYLLD